MNTMYFTQGVVLAKRDTGDADILYTIYTKDYGKIRALAPGIKKEGAKLRGHLEVLSASTIGFVIGKKSPRLVYAKMFRFWENMRTDFFCIRAAYLIGNWCDQHCLQSLPDEPIYHFLVESIDALEENHMTPALLKQFMKMRKDYFIGLLGGETSLAPFGRMFMENL